MNILKNCFSKRVTIIPRMQENEFYARKNKNGTIELNLTRKYELKEGDEYFDVIEFLIDQINHKNNRRVFHETLQIKFFSSIEFKLGKYKMQEQKCPICLCEFEIRDIEKELFAPSDDDVYALPCSHLFHKGCLSNMIGKNDWVKCPVCMTIYGKMMGDMPQGKMTHRFDKNLQLQGYPKGAIQISYSFPDFYKNGVQITGTFRKAFLPDTPEGREVLELLKTSFDRKLTFTVGKSVTTGRDNQVIWNGIHHKTSPSGGAACFGYPDQTYLKRVKQQLAAKGVITKKKN